jgi:hypothetical protein
MLQSDSFLLLPYSNAEESEGQLLKMPPTDGGEH